MHPCPPQSHLVHFESIFNREMFQVAMLYSTFVVASDPNTTTPSPCLLGH